MSRLMKILRTDLRQCCVEGCEELLEPNQIFCPRFHWPLVLDEEREEIADAWGKRRFAKVVEEVARDMRFRTPKSTDLRAG